MKTLLSSLLWSFPKIKASLNRYNLAIPRAFQKTCYDDLGVTFASYQLASTSHNLAIVTCEFDAKILAVLTHLLRKSNAVIF